VPALEAKLLPPWTCRPLPSKAWARMLGADDAPDYGAAAVSKIWARLDEKYRLVERAHGRPVGGLHLVA
jgi:hypothetical protein